jgi:hypothetical protein
MPAKRGQQGRSGGRIVKEFWVGFVFGFGALFAAIDGVFGTCLIMLVSLLVVRLAVQ